MGNAKKYYLYLLFFLLVTSDSGCQARPSFSFGAYSEAEHLYEKGEYPKAIEKYEEYLRENPNGNMAVISQYYMAKSYEGMGERPKAEEIYRQITKEHPDLIWANFSKTRLEELAKGTA